MADVKERWSAVVDRTPPAVLLGAGLSVVVLVFGALGLAILRADDGLDELGLAPPEVPSAADDGGTDGGGDDGSNGDGSPLAAGLTEDADRGGTHDQPGAAAQGAAPSDTTGASTPSTGAAAAAAAPERQASTTVPRSEPAPTTSTPSAPTTVASTVPPAPTTTEPPSEHPGLIGGLLHLLGLGG